MKSERLLYLFIVGRFREKPVSVFSPWEAAERDTEGVR
jgi:hypothetical protein